MWNSSLWLYVPCRLVHLHLHTYIHTYTHTYLMHVRIDRLCDRPQRGLKGGASAYRVRTFWVDHIVSPTPIRQKAQAHVWSSLHFRPTRPWRRLDRGRPEPHFSWFLLGIEVFNNHSCFYSRLDVKTPQKPLSQKIQPSHNPSAHHGGPR